MRVLIRVTRHTEYASIVEMPQEKYEEYQRRLAARGSARRVRDVLEAEQELNKLIDVKDWQDDSFEHLDEFEPFKDESSGTPCSSAGEKGAEGEPGSDVPKT